MLLPTRVSLGVWIATVLSPCRLAILERNFSVGTGIPWTMLLPMTTNAVAPERRHHFTPSRKRTQSLQYVAT